MATDALDVPEAERGGLPQGRVVREFDDLLRRASREGGYAESLAVFVPAKWVYLTWTTLATGRQRRVARLFERTVELEVAFFDAAYE